MFLIFYCLKFLFFFWINCQVENENKRLLQSIVHGNVLYVNILLSSHSSHFFFFFPNQNAGYRRALINFYVLG